MTPRTRIPPTALIVGASRIVVGLIVITVLCTAYALEGPESWRDLFDYFGYFTNLTSLITAVLLVATGTLSVSGRSVPAGLVTARAVATACMIIVGIVYNVLVPGTGSAPPWVSFVLHVVFPALVLLDWILIGDAPPLPWRRSWTVLPYPSLWLVVVLARGATDGWVPYGFLLPEHGAAWIGAHVAGLLLALVASGALVWGISRLPGSIRRDYRDPNHRDPNRRDTDRRVADRPSPAPHGRARPHTAGRPRPAPETNDPAAAATRSERRG